MNKQEALERIEAQKETIIEMTGWAVFRYIETLIEQLDESQKVTVPQFVADHLKKSKEVGSDLQNAMNSSTILEEVDLWLYTDDNMELFARAWLDGYTIEEKRYKVKMKAIKSNSQYLIFGQLSGTWWFGSAEQIGNVKSEHTHKELEDAGFGEVFNSPLFEVEEVKE